MQDKKPHNEQRERHGHWETYHDNGKLRFIGDYDNGKKIGVHKHFYDNGVIDDIDEYFDNGLQYSEGWYNTNELAYKGYYVNDGELGYWYENFHSNRNQHLYYAL